MSEYWGECIHVNLNLFKTKNVVLCCLSLLRVKGLLPVCCILSLSSPASLGFLDSNIFNFNELYYLVESSSLPFFPSLLYVSCYPHTLFCKLVDELRDYWILLFSWNTKGMFCLSVFVACWIDDCGHFSLWIVLPNNRNANFSVPSLKTLSRELSSGVGLKNKSGNCSSCCFCNL